MIQKNTLRTLLRDIRHLQDMGCHNEARLKLAVAFNRYDEARIITCLDIIQGCEKHLPRSLEVYRVAITERLLRHVKEHEGQDVASKVLNALTDKKKD